MISQITPTSGSSNPSTGSGKAPGEKLMGAGSIVLLAFYLVTISVLVLYGLIKLAPYPTLSGEAKEGVQATANGSPSPSPSASPTRAMRDPEQISFFFGLIKPLIYAETRLLLIVMLAGALGSLMHGLRSLYWYTGNRQMVWSWAAFTYCCLLWARY
jgi:hypothetical protein